MKRTLYAILAAACCLSAVYSASAAGKMDKRTAKAMAYATEHMKAQDARLKPGEFPKTWDNGEFKTTKINGWCTGFMAGCMWYIYEATGDPEMRALAEKNTHKLDGIVQAKTHHDIGFQVNSTFGNAYRFTGDKQWLPVLEASAAKLATRFNPTVGCIKSWDNKKYIYPVIIDNMMNLELLTYAADLFNCDSLRQIACTHANTTIKNHFRPDYSTWHLVDYNPETGEVDHKQTVQGYAHETAWSRGQSWGLYGYTMMYEYTKDEKYLVQAENIARYLLPIMPKDGIPYWDFNAPGTPDAVAADAKGHPKDYRWKEGDPVLRDSSAGAVMASAFISLSQCTKDAALAKKCMKEAKLILKTLSSDEYLAKPGENGGFLLYHGVGNLHGNSEVDVPLNYGDYYYLEALVKMMKLK